MANIIVRSFDSARAHSGIWKI